MKKNIIISLLFICSLNTLKAQDYETAIGLRFGLTNGLSLKHFISDIAAFEGLLAVNYKGSAFSLTGLYEIHANAFGVPNLNWYFGAGGGIGSVTNNFPFTLHVDGIVGLEYSISEIPINISLDFKPYFVLVGNVGLDVGSGLSIRYIFN